MDMLTSVYLFYSFIALYFLFFFILIFFPNRKNFFSYPNITKEYSLSIVIPCYNGEKNISGTIQALLNSDYTNLKKIIVVDDCSTDKSYEIIKKFAEKYPKVFALRTPENTGKASGAKNYGARFANTDLIGFTDDDSYPDKDAIRKMIGFFDDERIGAVTSLILVKNRNNLLEKLQAIEYKIIAFTRKLLGFVDAIYVTPGPLTIYRKSAFDEIGGFDENNLTEDIEITWNLVSKNYGIQMSSCSKVYTVVPDKFKLWFNQRIRWNVGGIQSINKHKKAFLKKGMLGSFILPFFVFSWLLGICGLSILFYNFIRGIIVQYLSATYSIQTQTAFLTLREINLTPNVLVFFGLFVLVLSFFFTIIALTILKEKEFKKHGLFTLFVYMFFYLLVYPLILIISMYKFLIKKYSW